MKLRETAGVIIRGVGRLDSCDGGHHGEGEPDMETINFVHAARESIEIVWGERTTASTLIGRKSETFMQLQGKDLRGLRTPSALITRVLPLWIGEERIFRKNLWKKTI